MQEPNLAVKTMKEEILKKRKKGVLKFGTFLKKHTSVLMKKKKRFLCFDIVERMCFMSKLLHRVCF
jgi:hypothetical protein